MSRYLGFERRRAVAHRQACAALVASFAAVAIEWPPTARAFPRSIRLARLERELITRSSRRHAHRHLALLACASRVRRCGASLPAMQVAERGRGTLIQSSRISRSSGVVLTRRHPACPPTSRGRSATSVHVPGRVVRRGRGKCADSKCPFGKPARRLQSQSDNIGF